MEKIRAGACGISEQEGGKGLQQEECGKSEQEGGKGLEQESVENQSGRVGKD